MKRIVESPLGKILQAIRENEVRAEAVGYNVPRFKLLAFVIGGAFSGLAGVLYAMLFGIVPLEAISFVFSGNVIFATLIGGSGSLYGPVIGSFVFIWLSESMSTVWARWPLLLGVAFVLVVLFLRGGVVEAWHEVLDMALLETKSLTKSFGALTAVNGVSLAVEAGSLHSIIGPNGAGKTTLFNLLTGTFPPTSGQILFDQKDITGTPANRVAHLGLARSYQRTTVFPAFSLFDNVWVAAFATGKSWKGLLHKNTSDYPEVAGARPAGPAGRRTRTESQPSWRARSRTASSASSSSPSRSPRRRACCCWTSRPQASRPRRRAAWWRWCARSRAATPSC